MSSCSIPFLEPVGRANRPRPPAVDLIVHGCGDLISKIRNLIWRLEEIYSCTPDQLLRDNSGFDINECPSRSDYRPILSQTYKNQESKIHINSSCDSHWDPGSPWGQAFVVTSFNRQLIKFPPFLFPSFTLQLAQWRQLPRQMPSVTTWTWTMSSATASAMSVSARLSCLGRHGAKTPTQISRNRLSSSRSSFARSQRPVSRRK